MYQYLIYAILLTFLSGCHAKRVSQENVPVIRIDIDALPSITVGDLFSEIEIVPLETSDSTLLGMVYPLFTSSYYFMRDNTRQQLVAFDTAGKFAFRICNQGRAPEQYRYMSQMAYNPASRELLIVDQPNTIHKYDLTGTFLGKKVTPFSHIEHVTALNGDTLLVGNGHELTAHDLYSWNGNKILGHLDDSMYYLRSGNFYENNRKLYHFKWFGNVVFQVDGQGLEACYRFDFGKYNGRNDVPTTVFEQLYRNRYDEDKWEAVFTRHFSLIIDGIQENSRYIFLNLKDIRDGFKTLYVIYHKEKKEAFLFDPTKEGVVWDNWDARLFEDCYVTFVDACQKTLLDPLLLTPAGQAIYQKIDENDNPVIIRYRFSGKGNHRQDS